MAKAKATGSPKIYRSFMDDNGFLSISLHSPNHTGEALSAMVDWINREGKFCFLRIGLSDTLNRFNYIRADEQSETQARKVALNRGQTWLAENAYILQNLKVPYEIIRWDHWHKHFPKKIKQNKEQFYQALHADALFKKAVMDDVFRYFRRNGHENLEHVDSRSLDLSLIYLIEELAVYSVIFADYPCTRIYPGSDLHCVDYIRNNNVPCVPQGIKNSHFIRLAIHGLNTNG